MSSGTKVGDCFADIDIKLRTPCGSPASRNASATIEMLRGLNSAAFKTTVLPQRMGIQMARNVRLIGEFHGAIANLKEEEERE